jgi:hypothetical protein
VKDDGMSGFIIFEILLLALILIFSLFDVISSATAAFVFLGFSLSNFIIGLSAWRGWPILRGDISENSPIKRQDGYELGHDDSSLDHDRPSTRLIVLMFTIGVIALSVGILLFQP